MDMEEYFKSLEEYLARAYEIAEQARKKGFDPCLSVEIPLAKDMAERVEGLVGPKGIADRIRELSREFDKEEVALKIAKEIVEKDRSEKGAEQALRTALAILTEGIVAAPLEGIVKVKIKENFDKTKYLAVYFAGPIRSAGGSAQALAVLTADYIRQNMGLDRYKPTEEEIERFVEEVELYDSEVARLQYFPSADEIRFAVKNIPVEITGEATDNVEVSGYRDLERIETNKVRGGAILVLAEGVLQKVPKILKFVERLNIKGWEWLYELKKDEKGEEEGEEEVKIKPNEKYLKDIVAGRPVLSHPSRKGGFRLRYGRCRVSGFASTCLHPVTMFILENFIAIGTQLKTERPGKGTAITPCDTIEPPVVRLKNGDVVRVDSLELAKKIKKDIDKILFLGDILIAYGEFLENNHVLMPSGYVEEWWVQELEKALENVDETLKERYKKFLDIKIVPSEEEALEIAEKLKIPLHPRYTYHYNEVSKDDLKKLAYWLIKGEKNENGLVLEYSDECKQVLEELLVEHVVRDGKVVIKNYKSLFKALGLDKGIDAFESAYKKAKDSLELVNSFIKIRPKALTYIGARMGRPEKAKERKMQPAVNVLFPIGNYGGRARDIKKASQNIKIDVDIAYRVCKSCGNITHLTICERCGGSTEIRRVCLKCGRVVSNSNNEERCRYCGGMLAFYTKRYINLKEILSKALAKVGNTPNDLKGVIGMTSAYKIPEPLEKGILRSKHKVYVFKDGTTRFDATDVPMTHFKPKEIHVSVEKLKELGYDKDYLGNELVSDEQIVELKVQDVVLPEKAMEYLLRVANFIDELLVKLYGLEPFYNAKKKEDLIGHLILGLAPHTSAAILGRIVGYTKADACFAHPYWHAAKRRNCFPADTEVLVNVDGEPMRIALKRLYEEFYDGENYEKMVYIKKKPKKEIKVYSFDSSTGKIVLTDVKEIIKAPSTDHLVRIKLENGKSFETTPDHMVVVYEDGKFKKKRAFEVKEGDLILQPKIDFEEKDIIEIDMLNEFSKEKFKNTWDKIMIRGIKNFVKKLVERRGLKETANILGINKKTLHNYYSDRDSIPLSILLKLLEINGFCIDDVPDCYIGFKRDHTYIKRKIRVDEDFMKLLGYFLAEGCYRKSSNTYQVDFAVSEEDLKQDIINSLRRVFGDGFKPYVNESRITVSNRALYHLFKDILKIGGNAREKRIPAFIFNLPREKVRWLLSAYFSGDCGVDKKGKSVVCTSCNRDLIRDIELLLLRFGIFASIYKINRKNSTEYRLVIRGENVELFKEKISFLSERKQKYLREVAKRTVTKPQKEYLGHRLLKVKCVEYVKSQEEFVYSLNVNGYHNILINDYIVTSNCDGDEDSVFLLMDALLNFSKYFLPSTRGGKMDAPLVITTRLDPKEVDDEAHNVDVVDRYPLEFYEATLEYKHPKEVKIETVSDRLGKPEQYYGIKFTHDVSDVNIANTVSAYKILESMSDKLKLQLDLARKIKAVDERDVATKVIESHFLPDILGNLRAFSRQSLRCVNCNAKYRRVPLIGKCTKCGGKLVLTVSKGAVEKYLNLTKDLIEKFNLDDYLRQRVQIIEDSISSVFYTKKKQTTLIGFANNG